MFCLSCVYSRETDDWAALANDTAFFDWKEPSELNTGQSSLLSNVPFHRHLSLISHKLTNWPCKVWQNNNSIAFNKLKKWSLHLSSYWREKMMLDSSLRGLICTKMHYLPEKLNQRSLWFSVMIQDTYRRLWMVESNHCRWWSSSLLWATNQ